MLRRALLFLCLAAPLAARAQTTNTLTLTDKAEPTVVNKVFGKADCTTAAASDPDVFLNWRITTTNPTYVSGDVYRITAASADSCPTDTGVVASVLPTAVSQRYPDINASPNTIKLSTIWTKVSATTCDQTADQTIFLCVALRRNGQTTDEGTARVSFRIQLQAPAKPTGLTVGPGDTALNLTWTAPDTTSAPAAASYEITVVAADLTKDSVIHTYTSTGTRLRADGLTNEVLYNVTVVAISEGGNRSAASDSKSETPKPVDDFWDLCQKDPVCKQEQGGCAGGAAGLLSLLGVAAALRLARRRS